MMLLNNLRLILTFTYHPISCKHCSVMQTCKSFRRNTKYSWCQRYCYVAKQFCWSETKVLHNVFLNKSNRKNSFSIAGNNTAYFRFVRVAFNGILPQHVCSSRDSLSNIKDLIGLNSSRHQVPNVPSTRKRQKNMKQQLIIYTKNLKNN